MNAVGSIPAPGTNFPKEISASTTPERACCDGFGTSTYVCPALASRELAACFGRAVWRYAAGLTASGDVLVGGRLV